MKELVSIAEKIAAKLIERKQTIAVAESATGGLISAALLSVPGASARCQLPPTKFSSVPCSIMGGLFKGL